MTRSPSPRADSQPAARRQWPHGARRTAAGRGRRRAPAAPGARHGCPCSTMRPRSITTIRSLSSTVASRWAMTSVVRPRASRSSAPRISASLSASRAEVGSSRSRIGASRRMARAIDRRWRSPPENWPAVGRDQRVVALRQRPDEAVGGRGLGGGLDLGAAGACGGRSRCCRATRAGQQHRFLAHHRDLVAQRGQRQRAEVVAVEQDPARGRVVEPRQQVEDRGLAGAGAPDEGDPLPGLDRQREVLERDVAVGIGEVHVLEADLADRARQMRPGRRRWCSRRRTA